MAENSAWVAVYATKPTASFVILGMAGIAVVLDAVVLIAAAISGNALIFAVAFSSCWFAFWLWFAYQEAFVVAHILATDGRVRLP